jgi:hypothetical protein
MTKFLLIIETQAANAAAPTLAEKRIVTHAWRKLEGSRHFTASRRDCVGRQDNDPSEPLVEAQ